MMSVSVVKSNAELDARLGSHVTLLYFWAEWCEPCKHMQQVVQQLAESYPSLCCVSVRAFDGFFRSSVSFMFISRPSLSLSRLFVSRLLRSSHSHSHSFSCTMLPGISGRS